MRENNVGLIELKNGIGECALKAGERRAQPANNYFLWYRPGDDESADECVVSGKDAHPGGNVGQFRGLSFTNWFQSESMRNGRDRTRPVRIESPPAYDLTLIVNRLGIAQNPGTPDSSVSEFRSSIPSTSVHKKA